MKKKVRKPKKLADIINFAHNTVDTIAMVAKPLAVIGSIPSKTVTYLRSAQAILIASNMASNILDEQESVKAQTVNA